MKRLSPAYPSTSLSRSANQSVYNGAPKVMAKRTAPSMTAAGTPGKLSKGNVVVNKQTTPSKPAQQKAKGSAPTHTSYRGPK